MTAQEVAKLVISRWLADQAPSAIMVHLICLGHPMTRADILAIVRRYIDLSTENITYGARRP